MSFKKLLYTLFLILFIFPLMVDAKSYSISDTDITVELDEKVWYVFTRDNIENNSELDELEISYDDIYNIMYDNNIYLDAVLHYDDGDYIEFKVAKIKNDKMNNLTNFAKEHLIEAAEHVCNEYDFDEYDIYQNNYNYVILEKNEKDLHIITYVTIVNGYSYLIVFETPEEFMNEEIWDVKNIVNDIEFNIDESLTDDVIENNKFDWGTLIERGVSGAIVGGITGLIVEKIYKKKKNDKKDDF